MGGNHVAYRQAGAFDGFVLSAEGAVGGDRCDPGESHQDLFARAVLPQIVGQGPVEHDITVVDSTSGASWNQGRETLVAADQCHAICAARRIDIGVFEACLKEDRRNGGCEVLLERLRIVGLVAQPGVEELIGDEDLIDPAQAFEGQVAEASAHGIADEEGTREHGGCGDDTKSNRQVGPAVVEERCEHESELHHSLTRC